MQIQHTVSFSLSQSLLLFRNCLEKLLAETNLHSGQIFIINELWNNDGQSQAELGRALKLSAPTVNKMIKSLVSSSFVISRKCKKDSRLMRVFLTRKGKEIQPRVLAQWTKLEESTLRDFSDTEKMLFSLLIEKLKKNFDL